MNLTRILDQLKDERARLNKAIAALESVNVRVGSRSRRSATRPARVSFRRKRRLSPEGRRSIQAAARRRWAKVRQKSKATT